MNDYAAPEEEEIYDQFCHHSMSLLDAIEALQKRCSYDSLEAERIVFEWVDGLEQEDEDDDMG